jgi:hypothetical protein
VALRFSPAASPLVARTTRDMPSARMVGETWVNRANSSTLGTQFRKHSTCQPAIGVRDLGAHGDSNVELNWSGASALWSNDTSAVASICPAHPHSKVHGAEGTVRDYSPTSGLGGLAIQLRLHDVRPQSPPKHAPAGDLFGRLAHISRATRAA